VQPSPLTGLRRGEASLATETPTQIRPARLLLVGIKDCPSGFISTEKLSGLPDNVVLWHVLVKIVQTLLVSSLLSSSTLLICRRSHGEDCLVLYDDP
jgi:hypothetical protein